LSSIEVVNAQDGVGFITVRGPSAPVIQVQFAGDRKIKFTPMDDPFFFFHGQCVATSGILEPPILGSLNVGALAAKSIPQPVITSHSCMLNLCLGGGGFSCIAIYSGSAFVFNFGKGIVLNNKVEPGIMDPVTFTTTFLPSTFEAPPLPPPFPGTIIGGKG